MLTQSRLKEVVNYNPETGDFIWIGHRYKSRNGLAAGHINQRGYRQIRIDGILYKAHRLAWLYVTGKFPEHSIDHISCIKTDNRYSNLRQADHSLNNQNIKKHRSHNKTGFLGVRYRKNINKYIADIRVNGKQIYLGLFHNAIDAHNAYLEAKRKYHAGCTI